MKSISAHEEKDRILRHALRGLKWNYAGTAARIASQLIAQIALARLLGPDVNGQFSAIVLALSLFSIWAEMGLGPAMVQAHSSDEKIDHDRACSRLVFISVILTLTVILLAKPIALNWLSTPSAISLLQVMALTAPLVALNVPPTVRLRRDLNFKFIQIIQLTSYVVAYIFIGVPWAWISGSPWSLVGAWLGQLVISNLLSWHLAPMPFKLVHPFRKCKWTRYGLAITATNTVNWTLENLIPMCINLMFGAHALGIFNIANNLVKTPATHLVTSLQSLLFPFSSKMQQDRVALVQIFSATSAAIMLVSIPFFLSIAVLSEPFVEVLLGVNWLEASSVLTPLAVAMIPHTVMAIVGPVMNATGHPQKELQAQATSMALLILAAFSSRDKTIEAMCWIMVSIFTFRALWMIRALKNLLDISAMHLVKTYLGPSSLGVVVAATIYMVSLLTVSKGAVMQLAAGLTVAGLTFAAGLLISPRIFLPSPLASALLKILEGRPTTSSTRWTQWLLKGL